MFYFSKSRIFLICCITFILGVAIASFLPARIIQNDLWWFAAVMTSFVLTVLFWKNRIIRIIALAGLFLFLALWRYSVSLSENTPDKIWFYNGQTMTVFGKIINEPDVRRNNVKYIIETQNLALPQNQIISGKILITENLYPRYNYGDEIKIACDLKAPEPFNNFSYDRYLARYDIYSVCYYGSIELVKREQGNWLYEKIFNLKNKLREKIDFGLPEPESALARAIMLGDKKGIPDNLREKFSQTGVSHIVAISGMHISILAGMIMLMLLGLGLWRKHAFYFATAFLVIYIILIGAPASAMRAGLMGFLVLWALSLGRLNKITNSLVLAAAILLLINPRLLRDDIGFQLSFLAVLGIVYIHPLLNNFFDKIKVPKLKGIRDILNITIAAQVFTLPIIAINFSQVSIIAPLANLLIIWILPILMVAVLIGLFFSFLLPNFSAILFLPAKIILQYIIFITDFLSRAPYAYAEIDYLWSGWLVVYYGIVGWAICWMNKNKK